MEGSDKEILRLDECELEIHVYQLHDTTHADLTNEGADSDEEATAATVLDLPAKSLDGLWDR